MENSNKAKLDSAIGKLLDQMNESLDGKSPIGKETVTILQILVQLTSSNYQL